MTQPHSTAPPARAEDASRPPAALRLAAVVAALEGLALVVLGILEAAVLRADRAVMGATTAVFFVAYGALLVLAAWALWRVVAWARGPVLLTQIIQLGLAWNFRGGPTVLVAVALALSAAVVLAGLLNRDSVRALEEAGGRR